MAFVVRCEGEHTLPVYLVAGARYFSVTLDRRDGVEIKREHFDLCPECWAGFLAAWASPPLGPFRYLRLEVQVIVSSPVPAPRI